VAVAVVVVVVDTTAAVDDSVTAFAFLSEFIINAYIYIYMFVLDLIFDCCNCKYTYMHGKIECVGR
jgi:hypothetical protein